MAPPEEHTDPGAVAGTIADLLDELSTDDTSREVGEDLVRVLMQFYGAGLTQMISIVRLGAGDTMVAISSGTARGPNRMWVATTAAPVTVPGRRTGGSPQPGPAPY